MVRQTHHERNQQLTICPKLVQGLNQSAQLTLKANHKFNRTATTIAACYLENRSLAPFAYQPET
jgi:hypothetical protein